MPLRRVSPTCHREVEFLAMDAVTKALTETIGAAGFAVQLGASKGHHVVEAVNEQTGERFVVRGEDLYLTVVELAGQVGLELEEG